MQRATRDVGILLLAGALVILAFNLLSIHSYRALSAKVHARTPASLTADDQTVATRGENSPDWETLKEINADTAAWIFVEGTDIDLPVMRARVDDPEFYLSHDLWGSPAFEGVPFLDHRCQADDTHRLVFGHRLGMGGQFSQLQKAYEQEVFDSLGTCHWSTPTGGSITLVPLCSLSVDMWYQPIQTFAFEGEGTLAGWLHTLAQDATARADSWESLALQGQSVLTLVTCSSSLSNQQWRTLVVFVQSE